MLPAPQPRPTLQDCVVLRKPDGTSRGFGFVTYDDEVAVEKCLVMEHHLGGRRVDVKRAVNKEEGGGGGGGGGMGGGGGGMGGGRGAFVAGRAGHSRPRGRGGRVIAAVRLVQRTQCNACCFVLCSGCIMLSCASPALLFACQATHPLMRAATAVLL